LWLFKVLERVVLVITNYIRELVKEEYSNTTITRELYTNHILVTADYGARLARLLGADARVVELASYLHDFSTVHEYEHSNSHTVKSSKKMDELLRQFKIPEDIISGVIEAVLNHSRPINSKKASVEAICLSNAEAMSQLSKPVFWLYYGYVVKKRTYEECIKVYIKWMEENWKTMIDPAKDMMTEEYAYLKKLQKLVV
jgi:uncharacterized protein